jgi:PBP1b-binding outer membrane lipoprotein LpoB
MKALIALALLLAGCAAAREPAGDCFCSPTSHRHGWGQTSGWEIT